jgi:hypothetical protein
MQKSLLFWHKSIKNQQPTDPTIEKNDDDDVFPYYYFILSFFVYPFRIVLWTFIANCHQVQILIEQYKTRVSLFNLTKNLEVFIFFFFEKDVENQPPLKRIDTNAQTTIIILLSPITLSSITTTNHDFYTTKCNIGKAVIRLFISFNDGCRDG